MAGGKETQRGTEWKKGGGYVVVSLMMILLSLVGAKRNALDNDDDEDARFVCWKIFPLPQVSVWIVRIKNQGVPTLWKFVSVIRWL